MKIAILLTGNLRTWRLCGHIIKNCLIDQYDCDVFMSIDLDNTLQHENQNFSSDTILNEIEDAIEFYKPKKVFTGNGYTDNLLDKILTETTYCVASPSPKVELKNSQYYINLFSISKTIIKQKIDRMSMKIIFEQYFYVKKAYELLQEYITENQTDYDKIIRLRFDQLIWSDEFYVELQSNNVGVIYNDQNIEFVKNLNRKLQMDTPLTNEIYVFGCGIYHNYVNDQFWVHGKDLITYMKSFYDILPDIINSCSEAYPSFGAYIEHFFALYLKNLKIMRSCVSGVFVRLKNN